MRKGTYFDGQAFVCCRIKKTGQKKTRIVLVDGTEKLVESKSVTVDVSLSSQDAPERLIPTIPLETLYRSLRNLTGSKDEQFVSLCEILNKRHGPKGAVFLAEVFRRSVRHAESYANVNETFYPVSRRARNATKPAFAKTLVQRMGISKTTQVGSQTFEFVDYEIFPFRTTHSCNEKGKPASRMGSGGMDLLLASNSDGVLPTIGEIKAGTETVGPTFALVQSLMYAAQMATPKQFLRLKRHYEAFAPVGVDQRRVDVIILLERDQKLNRKDLIYALSLAADLGKCLSAYLRHIVFSWCSIAGDAINCEIVKQE
jgi:hypothetical protein